MRLNIFTPVDNETPMGRIMGHITHLDIDLRRNIVLVEYTDLANHAQRGEYEIAQLFRGRVPEFLFTAPPIDVAERDIRATGPGLHVPIGEIIVKYPDQVNQLIESPLAQNVGIDQSDFIPTEEEELTEEDKLNIRNDELRRDGFPFLTTQGRKEFNKV